MEHDYQQDHFVEASLQEINNFVTFENTNNFDAYFSTVLPKTKIEYTFVSKKPLLQNKEQEELNREIKLSLRRKNPPTKLDWVEGHVTEISHWDPFKDIISYKLSNVDSIKIKKLTKEIIRSNSTKDKNNNFKESAKKTSNLNCNNIIVYTEKNKTKEKLQNDINKNSTYNNTNRIHRILEDKEEYDLTNLENDTNFKDVDLEFNLNSDFNYNYNISTNINPISEFSNECFNCTWIYPSEMNSEEINAHTNYCLDGKGEEHRKNYMMNLALVDKESKNKANTSPSSYTSDSNILNKNSSDYIVKNCPFCKKLLKFKSRKNIDLHIFDCKKEFEENLFYSSKSRRSDSKINTNFKKDNRK